MVIATMMFSMIFALGLWFAYLRTGTGWIISCFVIAIVLMLLEPAILLSGGIPIFLLLLATVTVARIVKLRPRSFAIYCAGCPTVLLCLQ
ncbi:MAG: hypothetical protein JWM11_2410, partial [Planctomycetaceae bacterium]|nr:hypothetical protein [Planctomycetaceae bacterium]